MESRGRLQVVRKSAAANNRQSGRNWGAEVDCKSGGRALQRTAGSRGGNGERGLCKNTLPHT
eukprot:366508-Chlamydomonas_euryale.AAC.8